MRRKQPRIILPLVQMIVCLVLLAVWGVIAGFIITQVPESYVPSEESGGGGRNWGRMWKCSILRENRGSNPQDVFFLVLPFNRVFCFHILLVTVSGSSVPSLVLSWCYPPGFLSTKLGALPLCFASGDQQSYSHGQCDHAGGMHKYLALRPSLGMLS